MIVILILILTICLSISFFCVHKRIDFLDRELTDMNKDNILLNGTNLRVDTLIREVGELKTRLFKIENNIK